MNKIWDMTGGKKWAEAYDSLNGLKRLVLQPGNTDRQRRQYLAGTKFKVVEVVHKQKKQFRGQEGQPVFQEAVVRAFLAQFDRLFPAEKKDKDKAIRDARDAFQDWRPNYSMGWEEQFSKIEALGVACMEQKVPEFVAGEEYNSDGSLCELFDQHGAAYKGQQMIQLAFLERSVPVTPFNRDMAKEFKADAKQCVFAVEMLGEWVQEYTGGANDIDISKGWNVKPNVKYNNDVGWQEKVTDRQVTALTMLRRGQLQGMGDVDRALGSTAGEAAAATGGGSAVQGGGSGSTDYKQGADSIRCFGAHAALHTLRKCPVLCANGSNLCGRKGNGKVGGVDLILRPGMQSAWEEYEKHCVSQALTVEEVSVYIKSTMYPQLSRRLQARARSAQGGKGAAGNGAAGIASVQGLPNSNGDQWQRQQLKLLQQEQQLQQLRQQLQQQANGGGHAGVGAVEGSGPALNMGDFSDAPEVALV